MAIMLGSFTSGLFEGANAVLGMKEGINRLKDWDTHDKAAEAAARQAADAMNDANKPQEYKPIDVRVDNRPAVAPGGGEVGTPARPKEGDDIPPPPGSTKKTEKPGGVPDKMPSVLPQVDLAGVPGEYTPGIPGNPNARPEDPEQPSWWRRPLGNVPQWMQPKPDQSEPGSFPPSPTTQPQPPNTAPGQRPNVSPTYTRTPQALPSAQPYVTAQAPEPDQFPQQPAAPNAPGTGNMAGPATPASPGFTQPQRAALPEPTERPRFLGGAKPAGTPTTRMVSDQQSATQPIQFDKTRPIIPQIQALSDPQKTELMKDPAKYGVEQTTVAEALAAKPQPQRLANPPTAPRPGRPGDTPATNAPAYQQGSPPPQPAVAGQPTPGPTAENVPPPVPPSEASPTGNMLTRGLSALNPISTAQAAEPKGDELKRIAEADKKAQVAGLVAPAGVTPPPGATAAQPPASSRVDMTVTPQPPAEPGDKAGRAIPGAAPGGLREATLAKPDSVTPPAAIPPKGATPPATPASDPAAKPNVQQPAGPSVSTPSTPVVADQQGPTEKSQPAPRVTQPPLNTSAWETVQRNRPPEVVAEIQRIAAKYGVSPERIAAHWQQESALRGSTPNGTSGEIGVMQIMPGTRNMVDPEHKLDPNNFWDNMELGARVIAQCDAAWGRDTVASAAAYNAGIKGAERMQHGNGPAITYGYVKRMFHGDVTNDMYATGSGHSGGAGGGEGGSSGRTMTGAGIMQAGQEGGPDGMINYIAQTGAPNATLTDKWHAANYAIIKDAYKHGGADGAQHAMDYITQMSHMGSNMSLMSAYRAMSAGDMTTAAQQLARAHTFFPDGAVGQFGVDGQGNLWAQRVSERDQTIKIGPAFKVTREGIESMLVQTTDTNKYVKLLSEQRASNQKISLEAARQKWYEGADRRAAEHNDAIIAGKAIGGGSGPSASEVADQRARETSINNAVEKSFHVDPSKVVNPEDLPRMRAEGAVGSLAMKDLMTRSNMPASTAEHVSRQVFSGELEMRATKDGRVALVRKGAPAEGASADAVISADTAAAISRVAPNIRVIGGAAPQPQQPQQPQQGAIPPPRPQAPAA